MVWPARLARACGRRAYATLDKQPDSDLMAAALKRALETLPAFSPQNIANFAWSLATLKEKSHDAKAFMEAAAYIVTQRLQGSEADDFSRQHLSNLIWAYATMEKQPGGGMSDATAKAMALRVQYCNPQELSNTVWSFAKLNRYNQPLMHAFAKEATQRMGEFVQPQNLANLAWAFGKVAHFDAHLMSRVADQTVKLIKDLALQHFTNIAWSFACFGLAVPSLMTALVEEAGSRLATQRFNAQQLCNLLWALTILRQCTLELWEAIMERFEELSPQYVQLHLPPEALTQVHQARLLLHLELPRGSPQPCGATTKSDEMLKVAADTWQATARRVHVSEFHADVSSHLNNILVTHTIEHVTDDGAFSIDIALSEEKIAIEVDGPHHFTANTKAPLGETMARRRLLAARGWIVVSVPFWHWDTAPTSHAKQVYLTQAISEARAAAAARLENPSQQTVTVMLAQGPAEMAAAAASG